MKKYLLIGLAILIGSNLAALAGVAYNRSGEISTHLTLTERELSLPYYTGMEKENSGTSLTINWRTPTRSDTTYYSYNSQDIEISKHELLALGFNQSNSKDNYWVESRELYWALEFNGDLYKAELEKAELNYQTAFTTYQEQPNRVNKQNKESSKKRLQKEKTSNSRLFFIEAAADYESLTAKFSNQENILFMKGLAKPYYNQKQKNYSLLLKHLLVSNIMIPLKNSDIFSELMNLDKRDITSPRYAVEVKWGSRLEPWVVDVKRLAK